MLVLFSRLKKFFQKQVSIYDERSVLVKRKAAYLLAMIYILTIAIIMVLVSYWIMGLSEWMDLFYYFTVITLIVMLNLVVRGKIDLAMTIFALGFFECAIYYFPSLPVGYDVAVTTELILLHSIWLLMAYKKWHRYFGLAMVCFVVVNRVIDINNAFILGVIGRDLMKVMIDSYIFLIIITIFELIISYIVSREIYLSQVRADEAEKNAAMVKEISYFVNSNVHDLEEKSLAEFFDEMTGLLNRRAFNTLLPDRFGVSQKNGEIFTLVYIDLNGLKKINDQYGHDYGDQYILAFSKAFDNLSRETDGAYRIGGDEFVVTYYGVRLDQVESILKRLIESFENNCGFLPDEMQASFSYGYASTIEYPNLDFFELVRQADAKMYEMKSEFYMEK